MNVLRLFSSGILILLFFCLSFNTLAQRETDNWHFGKSASFSLNQNGMPISKLGSAMNSQRASSSISDSLGNLLFYTDGDTIWNRQHQVMANGVLSMYNKDFGQTCIILPKPGSLTHYYVFAIMPYTTGPLKGYFNTIQYSEVDMVAQGGLGEVIPTTKNTALYTVPTNYWLSPKITAVRHANNRDSWLIAHRFPNANTHEFIVHKITAAGPAPTPITSSLVTFQHNFATNGILKASPEGNKIGGSFLYSNQLFDFNNRTGDVSNLYTINKTPSGVNLQFGLDFSQDGKKLYLFNDGNIEQYDLTAPNLTALLTSKQVINPQKLGYGFFQLASNGKIYITNNDQTYLSEITNPNVAGLGCNFQHVGPLLAPPTKSLAGLPNFMQSYLAAPRFEFTQACAGNPVSFTIPDQSNVDSVKWHFGEAGSASNTSRSRQPGHSFANPGSYTVALTLYMQGEAPVFRRQVTVLPWPNVNLGPDTTLCEGQALTLRNRASNTATGLNYTWSTGDTTASLKINQTGTYHLTVSNGICQTQDSVFVRFKSCRLAYIPNILTLNGDRKNETFAPRDLEEGTWKLQIFNRWGTRIYQTENYQLNWPNGKIATGTYYYLLENAVANQKHKGWLEVVN
jgi:hypothetical protein